MTEPDSLILLALAGLFAFGLLRWRQAVGLALVFAVFEGAVRKWVLPEAHQYVYFFKDALLLGAYAAYFVGRASRRQPLVARHRANVPLFLLTALAIAQLLNPALSTPTVGLLGLKAYLMYVPLMFLVPEILDDHKRLHVFSIAFLAISLVPLVLGLVQFQAPAESELNRYAWGTDRAGPAIFGASDQVRVTGTFSFISGYASYLVFVAIVALATSLREEGWRRWSLYAVLGLMMINLAMTGSRGPFLVLAVGAGLLLLMARRFGDSRVVSGATAVILLLPVLVVASRAIFPDVEAAFVQRVADSEDMLERVLAVLYGPFGAVGESGFFGYGIGSTHQGGVFVTSSPQSATPVAEGEWERIVLELGPMGLVLLLIARVLIARQIWLSLMRSPAELRPFLVGALVFVMVNFTGDVVFNHTNGLFYWFAAGLGLIPLKLVVTASEWQSASGRSPGPFVSR